MPLMRFTEHRNSRFKAPAQLSIAYSMEKSWDNYHVSDVRVERRVDLIECGLTNRKYAAQSRLIEHSAVSSTETDGRHALAVSSNSKCQEHWILTCKRVVLDVNLASFQQGH